MARLLLVEYQRTSFVLSALQLISSIRYYVCTSVFISFAAIMLLQSKSSMS